MAARSSLERRFGAARRGAGVAALLTASALGVTRTQPRLATVAYVVKEADDVYVLPPPARLEALTFGYHAAAVDLIWSKLLVAFGTHWHDKRDFHPDPYLESILELEPTYAPAYRFADTLLCYRPMHATEADARRARAILQEGTRERAGDYQVWQEYGQFSAYIGPSFLPADDREERDQWRRDGANAVARAVALGSDDSMSLAAAGMLERQGERDATIRMLQRGYAITDDPEQQALILHQLARLEASAANEAEENARRTFESRWKSDAPFVSRDEYLLMAPLPDVARCVGLDASERVACSRDWDSALGFPKTH